MSMYYSKIKILLIFLLVGCSSDNNSSNIESNKLPEPDIVTLLTNEASDITATTAELNGGVTSTGMIDEKGFYLSTNEVPSINDQVVSLGSGEGSFSSTYNFQTQGETIYYRVFATNSEMTFTGEVKSVKYFSQKPLINIDSPNSDSVFEIGDLIDILGEVTDEDGTVENIEIYVDDNLLLELTPLEATYSFSESLSTENLDVGNHEISITATDNFQDSSTKTFQIVLIEPIDDINSGLVAHYLFNGNANDETTFANHGIVNNAIMVPDRSGVPNSAYRFNAFSGRDEYIVIPATEQNALGIEDFTISVSFQAIISDGVIWSKRDVDICSPNLDDETAIGFKYYFRSFSDSDYEFFSRTKSGSGYGFIKLLTTPPEWHKFTVVREGGTLSWFFDDNPKVTGEIIPTSNFSTSKDLIIGSDLLCLPNSRFTGDVEEFRIYNRALSEEEVSRLHE